MAGVGPGLMEGKRWLHNVFEVENTRHHEEKRMKPQLPDVELEKKLLNLIRAMGNGRERERD